MTFDGTGVLERASHLARVWERELGSLVEHVPPFEDSYAALVSLIGEEDPPSDDSVG
jgi:hypothetical protein